MRVAGQAAIADVFGVAPKTINEWQALGFPIAARGAPGIPSEFDTPACIRWMVEREVRKVTGGETSKDRLARLQGDKIEMELAVERGHLVPAATIEPAMKAAIVTARERIRGEPARIAAALEGKDAEAREILLRDLFDEVLGKLSKWQPLAEDPDEAAAPQAEDDDERADD